MPRRALGAAALAAGLLTSGALPLLGSARATDPVCPAWTGSGGNATVNSVAATNQTGLDVTAASVKTTGTDLVATIVLASPPPSPYFGEGDKFWLQFSIGTTNYDLYVQRDATGTNAGLKLSSTSAVTNNGAPPEPGSATYGFNGNTVTITAPLSSIDQVAGGSNKGVEASRLFAKTSAIVGATNGRPNASQTTQVGPQDMAGAPDGTVYLIGVPCVPAPVRLPAGYPRVDCSTVADDPNDAKFKVAGFSVPQNDPDLDITSVAINTTETDLKAYLKVAGLTENPSNSGGHQFTLNFTVNGKAIALSVGKFHGSRTDVNDKTWGTRGKNGSSVDANLTPTPTFDTTNGFVIISLGLDKLSTAAQTAVGPGTAFTAVSAGSRWYAKDNDAAAAGFDADTAPNSGTGLYTVGDSPCFKPLPGILTNVGALSAQYSDAAAIAVKLTDAGGAPLEGRTLSLAVGGKKTTARTGADGVARTSWNPGLNAGGYTLVASFAGDDVADKVSLPKPFSVAIERTTTKLTVKKSGAKRTVIATVLDDDKRPVPAGLLVAWYVNGKKVTTSRTNLAGAASFATAKPTQTVKAVFLTVAGRYNTSSAQARV